MPKGILMPEQKTTKHETHWKAEDWVFTARNIGPREQRKRLVTGFVFLGFAIIALVMLMAADVTRWWRLLLFLPYWIAGSGYLQAREKTCVRLAALGACNLDHGVEKIEDAHLVSVLRSQAYKIHLLSLAAGLVLTGISLALP